LTKIKLAETLRHAILNTALKSFMSNGLCFIWNLIMNTSNSSNTSTAAKPIVSNNFFVPCVPISISTNLVAAQPLSKQLATLAPELAHLSLDDFANIQFKKSELLIKIDECASTHEVLLEVCLLNVGDLFSNLAAYLLTQGQVAENSENAYLQANLQDSLKQVHACATALDLVAADYCVDGVINPEMMLDACLKRLQMLQKRWQDNYFQSIKLALQLQRDAVYGAAANCLMDICRVGLDNQITLEPTPQAQEDVLVALATFVDLPFSGEWPVLKQRVIALGNEGGVQ
jgi:hypothetical protein